jgi:hypothetical protein
MDMRANAALRICTDDEAADGVTTLVIAPRFCGPPGTGNGGYVAGRLAAATGARGPVEVTLRRPAPLATALGVTRSAPPDPIWTLAAGSEVIAEARHARADADLSPPVRPAPATLGASGSHPDHPFPGCFTCGPARAKGDGLGIAPAPLPGAGDVVAAAWTPPADLAGARGELDLAIVWAALDCPGYFAIARGRPLRPLLLGRITASVAAPVLAGEPLAIIAWPLGSAGRRHEAATAIVDGGGHVRASSRQVWIAPREG